MRQSTRALPFAALIMSAVLLVACLPGDGSGGAARPTPTRQDAVQAARTVTAQTPIATASPTELPVLPTLAIYVVKSGDYPTLIAENAGVPADVQDAWITEMLALNGVTATTLQIGQKLILPPYGDGSLPSITSQDTADTDTPADPPAGVLEPAQPVAAATSTPKPQGSPASVGVPFAPTPPFVAFTTPTATPTPPSTPTSTPTPTMTPTATAIPAGTRAWLTSSDEGEFYYYCDLDPEWHNIPGDKLIVFDSEQQLLAVWGRFRVKAPNSAC